MFGVIYKTIDIERKVKHVDAVIASFLGFKAGKIHIGWETLGIFNYREVRNCRWDTVMHPINVAYLLLGLVSPVNAEKAAKAG